MLPDKRKKYLAEWREKNRERLKDYSAHWHEANKHRVQEQTRKYREENKEAVLEGKRQHYYKNRERISLQQKEYAKNTRPKIREYRRAYHAIKKGDPLYFLPERIRHRIRTVLKYKSTKTSDLVGCTYLELKLHLESLFLPGMTWENYGYRGWHIDHIMPLKSFDLSDPNQLAKACHYTNLQPLWGVENMKKGSRVAHE